MSQQINAPKFKTGQTVYFTESYDLIEHEVSEVLYDEGNWLYRLSYDGVEYEEDKLSAMPIETEKRVALLWQGIKNTPYQHGNIEIKIADLAYLYSKAGYE